MSERPTTEEGRRKCAVCGVPMCLCGGGVCCDCKPLSRSDEKHLTRLAAPPSEQEEPHTPQMTIDGPHCQQCLDEMERAASTPVPALRHHPNDNCGDPEHHAILEAWYARAEALLDRPALDEERLARAIRTVTDNERYDLGYVKECARLADDVVAEYSITRHPRRLSGDEGGAG